MLNHNNITQPKAELIEEKSSRLMSYDGKDGEARYHFEAAAEALRDAGDNWIGSYMVHIYQNPITMQINWKTLHKDNHWSEQIVSKSLTDLRSYLMGIFGKQERKRK